MAARRKSAAPPKDTTANPGFEAGFGPELPGIFLEKLAGWKDIERVFSITDSEESFAQMRRMPRRKHECGHLHKSYLENFRIITRDALQR